MNKLLLLFTLVPFIACAMDNQDREHAIEVPIYRTGPNGRIRVATYRVKQTPTLTFKQIASAIKDKYQTRGDLWLHYLRSNETLMATHQERIVAKFAPESYTLFFEAEPINIYIEPTKPTHSVEPHM